MKNKRGQIIDFQGMVMYFIIIALILLGSFALIILGVIGKNIVSDTAPVFSSAVGTVSSEAGTKADKVVTGVSNSIPWLAGVIIFISFVGILGLAYAFRVTGNKLLIVLYLGLFLLMIMLSILVSNMYQTQYEASGDIGDGLREAKLASWIILYSPLLITILCLIGAIIMFSGLGGESVYA